IEDDPLKELAQLSIRMLVGVEDVGAVAAQQLGERRHQTPTVRARDAQHRRRIAGWPARRVVRAHFWRLMPGAGNDPRHSLTSAATAESSAASSGAATTRLIHAARSFISAGPRPRLVTEGVPMRIPEGSKGFRGS